MEQIITTDGEPLLQFLPVEREQDRPMLKRYCPFIGITHDAETVMAFPTLRNHCHRIHPSQVVSMDYQSTHCLTFAHRHCPVLLSSTPKALPPGISVSQLKKRSLFVVFGLVSAVMLLVIAFLLFSGWHWTSASGLIL